MRFSFIVVLASALACFANPPTAESIKVRGFALDGRPIDPFARAARANVFLFVRTDCPITNRYAPELARIAQEFSGEDIKFWLVYADRTETVEAIEKHVSEYHLPGTALRDPQHHLVAFAHVTVAPEAAVFDRRGHLEYHGRIDDRYVEVGKARAAAQVHDLEDAVRDVLAGKPVPHPETRAVGCSLADVE
jgi:hypothetical protein